MQCEEFRILIHDSVNQDTALEQHLANCDACATWLQKEVSTPPEGLTPAQWQEATARCLPEILTKSAPIAATEKSQNFWDFYLNGLKYGMVFGLSLITGFALLKHLKPEVHHTDDSKIEMVSFLDSSESQLPVFYENKFSDVTFVDSAESQSMSFISKEQIPIFFDELKEDEKWTERSS